MLGGLKHLKKPASVEGGGGGTVPTTLSISVTGYTTTTLTVAWSYVQGTYGTANPSFSLYTGNGPAPQFVLVNGYPTTGTTTHTFTGLTPGATYYAYVSTPQVTSNTVTQTLSTDVPSAPTNVVASSSQANTQRIEVSWTMGSANGLVINYVDIEGSADGGSTWTYLPPDLVAPVVAHSATGLTAGTDYVFRVRAHNSAGWGPWSNVSNSARSWGYNVQSFTASGTWTLPSASTTTINILMVGGGGGGGSGQGAGGGGAGEVVYRTGYQAPNANTSVTIGTGGAVGSNGNATTFASLTAAGGGKGGSLAGTNNDPALNGSDGGSGGGASRYYYGAGYDTPTGGNSTATQTGAYGNAGAKGSDNTAFGTPQESRGGGGGGIAGPGSTTGARGPGSTLMGVYCGEGGSGSVWSPDGSQGAEVPGTRGSGYGAGGGGNNNSGSDGYVKIECWY